MDTLNSFDTYNKVNEPKVVDTVRLFGKYVDASSFKSKVIAASASALFIGAITVLICLL